MPEPAGPRRDPVLAELGLVSMTWVATRLGYSREGVRRLWLRGRLLGDSLEGPEHKQTLVFRREVVETLAIELGVGEQAQQ